MPQASAARIPQASAAIVSHEKVYTSLTTQAQLTQKVKPKIRSSSKDRQSSVPGRGTNHGSNGCLSTTVPRPLPPGPGPLDAYGRKLDTGRSLKSNRTRDKHGPLKADHSVGIGACVRPPGQVALEAEDHQAPFSCKTTLTRSKSVSQNDLKHIASKIEQIKDQFSAFTLRTRSPSLTRTPTTDAYSTNLRRSSSLRTLNRQDDVDKPRGVKVTQPEKVPESQVLLPEKTPFRIVSSDTSTLVTLLGINYNTKDVTTFTSSDQPVLGTGRVGLRNLGNTCFMNSILQCLSNTQELRDYCLRREYRRELSGTSRTRTDLIDAFSDVLADLWRPESSEPASPGKFKCVFQKFFPYFTGYSQQDAQEFLKFLMERLHCEINRKGQRSPRIMTNMERSTLLEDPDTLREDEKAMQAWKRYLEREDSKIVDLFVGQLKSSLKCLACGHRSIMFEVFCDLSLPIPKKYSGKVSLDDCFSLFTREEDLEAENAPMCSRCGEKKKSSKKLTIQRFPKILVLHLNRFSTTKYSIKKCVTYVEFPLQKLNLHGCTAEKAGNAVYNLYAVCNHSGTVHGGHYTSYCKDRISWYCYNDTRVSTVHDNQVLSSEAYVLFYKLEDTIPSK